MTAPEPAPAEVRQAVRDIRLARVALARVRRLDDRGRRMLLAALGGADPELVLLWIDWLGSMPAGAVTAAGIAGAQLPPARQPGGDHQ